MNVFEQLKQKILAEHPSHKTLPLIDRIRIWISSDNEEIRLQERNERGTFGVCAVLVRWKGKTYHYKWGRLS